MEKAVLLWKEETDRQAGRQTYRAWQMDIWKEVGKEAEALLKAKERETERQTEIDRQRQRESEW